MAPSWVQNGVNIGPKTVSEARSAPGPILGRFWVDFGSMLDRFWDDFWLILGRFLVDFRSILGRLWSELAAMRLLGIRLVLAGYLFVFF